MVWGHTRKLGRLEYHRSWQNGETRNCLPRFCRCGGLVVSIQKKAHTRQTMQRGRMRLYPLVLHTFLVGLYCIALALKYHKLCIFAMQLHRCS